MLLAGTKPLRYVDPRAERPEVDQGLVVHSFEFLGGRRYLMFKPENTWRARAWHRTDAMHQRGVIATQTAHVRRGLLLGYPKQAIRIFLRRLEPLR